MAKPDVEAFWGDQYDGSASSFFRALSFQGVADVRIAAVGFLNPSACASIVLLPGKSESYVKYKEIIWQLFQHLNMNVYAMDHRSQGLSGRLTGDKQKVHVHDYQDYVADFLTFVSSKVRLGTQQPCFLLAHSMGAAVATLGLLTAPLPFCGAVMSAPMYRLRTGRIPDWLAETYVNLCCYFDQGEEYVVGYQQVSFEQWLAIMHRSYGDKTRLREYQETVKQHMDTLTTFGVTNQWTAQWFKGTRNIRRNASKLPCPVLLLSAQMEDCIENDAHYIVAHQSPQVTHCIVAGAGHEIQFESDTIRNAYFHRVVEFIRACQPLF